MPYPDDLLALAEEMAASSEPVNQAKLCRALSTAYYAFFHLLVQEAAANCQDPEFRVALTRVFDHGGLLSAASKQAGELNAWFKSNPSESPDRLVREALQGIVNTFIQAQHRRIDADYNMAVEWHQDRVEVAVAEVRQAFRLWSQIRQEPLAKSFLASLLPGRARVRPRE